MFDAGLWSARFAAESVLSLQHGAFFCHGIHFPSHFLHFLVVEVRISRGKRHSYGGARLCLTRGSGRQKSRLKVCSRCSLALFSDEFLAESSRSFAFCAFSGRGGAYFPRNTTLLWGCAVTFETGLWSAGFAAESVLSLQPGAFLCCGMHSPSHSVLFLVVEVRIS